MCTERLLSLHNKKKTLVHPRDVGRADLDWFGRHDGIKT